MENIKIFFAQNFTNFIWLAVFILALLPFGEGRLAYPFAINQTLLKENAQSPFLAILTCFFAGIFLCLFLLVFFNGLIKVLNNLSFFRKITNKLNDFIKKKSEKFQNFNFKNSKKIFFLLAVFVFIPLPLTGVWTACLISSFLNLDAKKSFVAISLGNLCMLFLISFVSLIFKNYTLILILICFVLTFLYILFKKLFRKKFSISFLSD